MRRVLHSGSYLGNWGGSAPGSEVLGRLETSRPHLKLSFPLPVCEPADEKAERKPAQRG